MSAIPPGMEVRLPPHNRDAERSLIGSMLRDNTIIDEVIGLVGRDDFYIWAHGLLFDGMIAIHEQHGSADIVQLAEWVNAQKQMDEIGGPAYLAELWDAAPSAANYPQYADIIRQKAIARSIIHACGKLQSDAYELGVSADELVADLDRFASSVNDKSATSESVELHVALLEAFTAIEGRIRNQGEYGVPTGFIDLDAILCGFRESELIVVGARPSVGKTAWCLSAARNAAVDYGVPVLFISLEQSRRELAERLLCSQGAVDSHKMRRGHIGPDEMERLFVANDHLGKSTLIVDDKCGQNISQISANVRRQKKRHGIKLVMIDYLQLIQPSNDRANRQEQVSEISRRLKLLARDVSLPVIVAAQLNRGVEDRVDKRPRLSDLRESGAIEQDADTVLLLHRETTDTSLPVFEIDVIVAKQRNGPTGESKLAYKRSFMRFENFAQGY